MPDTFAFVPPPEAPVFYPTPEEFNDPLAYIMKIRHVGVKTGICKIVPPKSWNPPFAVNLKDFSFTPRLQRLYELEAHSRIKLSFLSKLYKFVRLQGGEKIRVPSIGGRYLDLYALHKLVAELGGHRKICDEHSWHTVTERLGYHTRHTHSIRINYEKILLSFDQIVFNPLSQQNTHKFEQSLIVKRHRTGNTLESEKVDYSMNKELKNLQFFGAGPKTALPVVDRLKGYGSENKREVNGDEFTCRVCKLGDDETNLLVCDTESCQACYHLYCLSPPLRSIPKCLWKCPDCVRQICLNPNELYGFPQSTKSYSLHEFGVMADEFKSVYFKRPCTEVPCAEVEQEFWRILQEYNDDVVVEYGADIHSSDQGSGFPTQSRLHNFTDVDSSKLAEVKEYICSPWNLNVLPLLDRSVLRFIKGNIDGMKIPWCYVGMVFSSFCWHIEDHWSYSINFNHWGEPKTWYGVSQLYADEFERGMRKHAQELFDEAPDLLHHITTNMNPNLLQAEGVPIYRTDQRCGEFVITFPRAYHSGFNQGFNFAEAVNICLPDWLPVGRSCIQHYAEMKRHCVFSHDELLCTLAEVAIGRMTPEEAIAATDSIVSAKMNSLQTNGVNVIPVGCSNAGLDIACIAVVHQEFTALLKDERHYRDDVKLKGISGSEQISFDEMSDDARVCDYCLTTLFLSGVSCMCAKKISVTDHQTPSDNHQTCAIDDNSPTRKRKASDSVFQVGDNQCSQSHMVCLKHVDYLCDKCPITSFTLKYHYTLDELVELEKCLAERLTNFYTWRNQLNILLNPKTTGTRFNPSGFNTQNLSSLTVKHEDINNGETMTLKELEVKLSEGSEAGYHTDEVFNEAKSIYERGKYLTQICAQLKPVIFGTDRVSAGHSVVTSSPNCSMFVPETGGSTAVNMVRFQFRRPANFTVASTTSEPSPNKTGSLPKAGPAQTLVVLNHEFDINNPRETDLFRLLEACEQQYPLNLLDDSDVKQIKYFIHRISEWRQCARDTVNSLCHLVLTNATRSITSSTKSETQFTYNHVLPSGACIKERDLSNLPSDEQALVLLEYLLKDLQNEFPGFVFNLAEWNLLNLVRRSLKWLCIYAQRDATPKCIYWSLLHFRQYLVYGEDIITQLTSTTSVGPKSQIKSIQPHSTSLVGHSTTRLAHSLTSTSVCRSVNPTTCGLETALTPIMRLLRARMHTSLGHLTQISVQAESLVGILVDILNTSNCINYSELDNVLNQLLDLDINHLIYQPNWMIVSNTGDNGAQQKHQLKQILSDGGGDIDRLDSLCTTDDIAQLCSLYQQHVDQILVSSSKDNFNILHDSRPHLLQAEVLHKLGKFLSTLPPVDDEGNQSVSARKPSGIVPSALNEQFQRFSNLITASETAINDLNKQFSIIEQDSLLRNLLPIPVEDNEVDEAIQRFRDACSSGFANATAAFNAFSKSNEDCILKSLKQMTTGSVSCSQCAYRFRSLTLMRKATETETSCSSCKLCQMTGKSQLEFPSIELLSQFKQYWNNDNSSDCLINSNYVVKSAYPTDANCASNYGDLMLLQSPESMALSLCLMRVAHWMLQLKLLINANLDRFGSYFVDLNTPELNKLPCIIHQVIETKSTDHTSESSLINIVADSNNSHNNDSSSHSFMHQSSEMFHILSSFHINLNSTTHFIQTLLNSFTTSLAK